MLVIVMISHSSGKVANEQFFVSCKKEMLTFVQFFSNLLYKLLHKENCTKIRISLLQLTKNCSFTTFLNWNTYSKWMLLASLDNSYDLCYSIANLARTPCRQAKVKNAETTTKEKLLKSIEDDGFFFAAVSSKTQLFQNQ